MLSRLHDNNDNKREEGDNAVDNWTDYNPATLPAPAGSHWVPIVRFV
jgi:hypothetical protein